MTDPKLNKSNISEKELYDFAKEIKTDITNGDIKISDKYNSNLIEAAPESYGFGESKYDDSNTSISTLQREGELEQVRAQKQGLLNKWSNGITKAVGISGTSILENTAGVVYGISDALIEGDASKLYNNDFSRSLDSFNEYVAKNMPNYHTKAEEDYNLIQKLGTSNFWSDQVLSGAAYMGAAIATGAGLSKFASLAKLAGAGKVINEAEILETGWQALDKAAKGVKLANAADFAKNATLMSYGESSIEARGIYNDTKERLIQDFINKNGYQPDAATLETIESDAKAAGNFGFATNLAITGTTNALLFPKLLTKGYTGNKLDLNKIELRGGKFVSKTQSIPKGITKETLKGALEEGSQELGQLLTQKTLTDYYSKGFENRGEKHDFVQSLMFGLEQTLGTQEGLENFFLGSILGGPAGGIQARGNTTEQNIRSEQIANILNGTEFKKIVNSFNNFVRATNYEQDKDEALLKGSKFDYLNAEFNQNKSIAKQFLDNGAKEILINQYKDIQSLPEEEFKKVTGYDMDKPLPSSQVEIVNNAINLVENLDAANNSIKELFPYSQEVYSTPENYKILTDNLWHYSTSIDNMNNRIKDINNEVFKIASNKNINITGDTNIPEFVQVDANPVDLQKIAQFRDDLQVAKLYRDKLIESYNLLSNPQTQAAVLTDIISTAQAEAIKSTTPIQNEVEVVDETQDAQNLPNNLEQDINDQLNQIDMVENFELEQIDSSLPADQIAKEITAIKTKFEKSRQALTKIYEVSKFNGLISNATSEKELDSILQQLDSAGLTTPELIDGISLKRRDLKSATSMEVSSSEVIDTNNDEIVKSIDSKYDLQGKLAQTVFKTVAGEDNDKKIPEQRYFRFLEKNDIKEGSKLLVVTKNNNKTLFDKLLDKDAKAYEEKTKIDTIYTVLVDKNNNPIYSSQKGELLESGDENNLVYATLLTEIGIDSTGVKNKDLAKIELNDLRSKLLSAKGNVYLLILDKSQGILIREKKTNGERVINPVLGHLTTNINKKGLLQLPTIALDNKGTTQLKNGEQALVGRLYGFSDNNEAIDLVARKPNEDEALLITNLILQRMGVINKTVNDPSSEIDKFIFFGIPKDGVNDKTVGIKGDILYIGNKTFKKEELTTPEAVSYLTNFLQFNKNLNVTNKIDFSDQFDEPVFNSEEGTIFYKKWDTYQEFLLSSEDRSPIFGTDLPAIGKPKFRNFYLTYEPTVILSDIEVAESEIKQDITEPESTNILNISNISGINVLFKKYNDLNKIGTIEQYSKYIDSIFPDSKIKKIIYHYTNSEIFEKFNKKGDAEYTNRKQRYGWGTTDNGIYFSDKKINSDYGSKEISAIINVKKLKINNIEDGEVGTITDEQLFDLNKNNIDGIYQPDILNKTGSEYVVFQSEQVHILGSKQDIEGFKKWKEDNKSFEIKEDKKIFKKSGSNRKINLDRLNTLLTNNTTKVSQEEGEWFKSQFPAIPVKTIKGLIDNNSFGRFISNGRVILSDLAPNNTLRHEAFHVVTQLYLTPKEISDIYSETRNRLNNQKLSDLEVEEILAEDFANYKDNGRVLNNRPLTKNIFQKLLTFLKKLVGLNNTQIRDIYNKLETGQFLGKQIVGNNQFRTLDKSLPGKTEQFTKETLDGVDYEFFAVLFENGFTPEKLFQVNNLTTKIYDIVRDSFIDRYESAITAKNQNAIDNFGYILENWDSKGGIIELHNARIQSLGIELVTGINEKTLETSPNTELVEDPNLISEDSVIEDENKSERSGDAYKNSNTISTKDSMFKQTKLFIRTLPQVDKSGELILNSIGLPQLVDFNGTYNFLLKNLSGISNYPVMIEKLRELSNIKPEFNVLIERLGESSDTLSLEQLLFQNQFRQDFDKNQAISYKTLLKPDGTVYVVDATKENTTGKIKDTWKNNLFISPSVKLNDSARLITTNEALKSKSDIEFLSKIGIIFSNETLPYLENNENFSKSVLGIKKYIVENKLDLTDLFSSESDAKGNINILLDIEAKYTTNINELSFLSTEGKTVYSISLNNQLSIVKNIINNSKTKADLFIALPHLNTVYNQNSLWLKEIFDSKGNKRTNVNINLDLLDGVSTVDSIDKSASQTSKLSKGDKFVQELNNLLLEGKTAFIRASDKSTEHAISLSSYGKGRILPISTTSLKEGFNNIEIKDIFRGYFKDEAKKIYELEVNDLGKDIDVYRKAGSKWGIFSDFPNSSNIKNLIGDKIKELKSLDLTSQEKESQINSFINTVLPQVDEITINFFNKYTEELIKEYESLTFKDNTKLGIAKELLDKYSFEQIMRSLAVNDFINSVEQIKLFVGDMSFYKDLFKRTSGLTGTKKTARVDNNMNNWLNINSARLDGKISDGKINVLVFQDSNQSSNYLDEYINSLVESGVTEEQARTILSAYTSMDEADAQGYITLDEYKEFFVRTGDWRNEHEVIFNKAKNNEVISAEEIFYFMPIKAQYFGPQEYNDLYAPAYHKFSLMPLIPQMVKGTNLEKLLDNMTNNQVGYSLFKSGSKVGTKVDPNTGLANKFYENTTNGNINSENLIKQVVDYKFLGIQLDIAPKLKKTVIFGTQFRKLLFSNLFENGTALNDNSKKLFTEYTNIFNELIASEKSKLVSELGLNPSTYKAENVSKLVELLRKESKDRNLPDNVIDALQTEVIEGKVLLKYNFDSMVNKTKIDSMIMSLVNSRLIRQMMNGDAMIQGASTGFEKLGSRVEGSNDLKFYRKDPITLKTLPMEVKVPLTGEYRDLLKNYKTIENINEAIEAGKIDSNKLSLIGYRIPTQGLNSIEYMIIKGFLPETAGNLIILPTEVVAKSGGDYDIDKLNIFRPWLNPTTDIQNKQNRIIDIAKEIIESESNFNALITPNSTKILTDVVDELRYIEFKNQNPSSKVTIDEYIAKYKSNLGNIRYTNQLKLQTKLDQFSKFLGGKAAVGIGALQNTHHILSQITNLSLNKFYHEKGKIARVEIYFPHNKTSEGNISLSKIKDVSGNNNISEVISQIINASVDIAKDPFMFDLNMNTSTLSTYLYLIRTGVDFEQIAYFMKQPIITEYLNEIEKNKSIFMKISGKSEANKKVKNRVLNSYKSKLSLLTNLKTDELEDYIANTKYRYDISVEELKSNLNKENQNSEQFILSQIQLLDNYLDYKKQGELLSEAIQSVNHDTSGVGENLNSSRNKEDQKLDVKNTGFINNIDNIYNNTFIGAFDHHKFTIDAYNQFYDSQNNIVTDNNKSLLESLTNEFTKQADKDKLYTLIENDFVSYIVQNYGYNNISDLTNKLFFGENSVAKEILRIKTITNPTVEEKLLSENLLVKELYPLLEDKNHSTDNVKLYSKRFDTFTSNQLTEAFRELQDLNPELSKNLMDLGIIQSGLNKSAITYFNVIPFEYYGDLVKNAFDKFNKEGNKDLILKDFNQLFIRNNSKDSLIYKMANKLGFGGVNSLGNGMYGKSYARTQFNTNPSIESENIAENTEEDYIPEIIENSSNNLENYDTSLINSKDLTTFALSEEQIEKIKIDIESSLLSQTLKDELLLDLSNIDSEKKYADLIRKFCK